MSTPKKKILFIAPSMNGGGAERFLSIALKYINQDKFLPVLALVKTDGPLMTRVPKEIEVIRIGGGRVRNSIGKIVRLVWRERPDVIFSTIGHMNIAIMLVRPFLPRGIKFIARETNIPSLNTKNSPFPRLLPVLYRMLYPLYHKVICQSKDMANDLILRFGFPNEKLVIINNPVDVNGIMDILCNSKKQVLRKGRINIVSAGKLKYQKGFDLLLKVLEYLGDEKFYLTILGVGPEMSALKKLSEELGVSEQVSFVGFESNPFQYFAQADLVALTSRFEGFPNVLLEANICGTPVVAFECLGGINEIIEDGTNGFKVRLGDTKAFAEAIRKSIKWGFDPELVKGCVEKKFNVSKIMKEYEDLLSKI